MRRPTNHVVRAVAANSAASGVDGWPPIPKGMVEFLERTFPPRCRAPGEDHFTHERYAGRVDLIAELRQRLEREADFTAEAVASVRGGLEVSDEDTVVDVADPIERS